MLYYFIQMFTHTAVRVCGFLMPILVCFRYTRLCVKGPLDLRFMAVGHIFGSI